jgi:hypothetical protein
MAASSSVDPFCMVSFPTFDEDIKESENNSVQSGGLIGLLSNLFRPSSNNTRSSINLYNLQCNPPIIY